MNDKKILYKELSYKIVNILFEVHNTLGCGFLEKVYENALMIKFRKNDVEVKQQHPLKIYYESEVVGEYFADIIVEDKIILELKCVNEISDVHRAQMINYLKATKLKLGLIVNFSKPKLQYERIVL